MYLLITFVGVVVEVAQVVFCAVIHKDVFSELLLVLCEHTADVDSKCKTHATVYLLSFCHTTCGHCAKAVYETVVTCNSYVGLAGVCLERCDFLLKLLILLCCLMTRIGEVEYISVLL